MNVRITFDSLKRTRWYQYLVRFVFGGAVTAATGLIASKYGPVVGGLFLAIPSIFPASITLVQTHKKEQGEESGERAAGETAGGAGFGSIGLLGFAVVIWQLSTRLAPWLVLLLAFAVWLAASILAWWIYTALTHRAAKRSNN